MTEESEMPVARPDQCRCPKCLQGIDHPDGKYHRELIAFLGTLNHEQRRLFAAVESNRLGWGGVGRVSEMTGLCKPTITLGRHQLEDLVQGHLIRKNPKKGTGRPRTEQKYPTITATLEDLLSDEVAGSPEGEERWVRSSCRKLADRLNERGFPVTYHTVWSLLKRMGFSMKTHVRNRRGANPDPSRRDEQFRYIASQRKEFCQAGLPAISVDTKKKELIGNFRNPGKTWCRRPREVNEHDYASQAECLAVPFGIYDVAKNTGYVIVGMSHNTSEFAVSSISIWWEDEGRIVYPEMSQLLILADGGGGNGSRSKAWRWNLQEKICNPYHLTVTVCHYPPGCSKWNPVEHRLFSQISNNWAGKPLRSLAIMLGYIRGTTTTTGLTVQAVLDEGIYPKGQKVSWKDVDGLNLTPHEVCPEWNYTIRPSE
jgi:Rhodopirellula transposase DDE domain